MSDDGHSTPSDDLDDRLDKRLDKRLTLLQDSMELKLTKEVDALLRLRIDAATKTFGWAFGLVAVVFGAFGVKTVLDVREIARTTTIEEVKKKLAIDDPNSEFRRDIDKVVARGLIDSYLLSLAKGREEEFPSDLWIAESDLRRLIDLVRDPSTSEKDFADACEVLLKSTQMGNDQSIDRLFKHLGAASDDRFKWIRDQPEKRAALLRLYSGSSLQGVARDILDDEKAEKPLTNAAIEYATAQEDPDALKAFARLARNKDEDIAFQALIGLARTDPESAVLRGALEKPKRTESDDDWASSLRLAANVAKPSRRRILEADPQELVRISIASRAIEDAIEHGVVFRLSESRERTGSSLCMSSRANYSTTYSLSSDLLLGPGRYAFQDLLRRGGGDAQRLAMIVRALCLEEEGECWGVVKAGLNEGGRVVLKSGATIDKGDAPAGVILQAASVEPGAEVRATWTDGAAVSKSGSVARLDDAEKIEFQVTATKRVSATREW
jgi:hypothetical protein